MSATHVYLSLIPQALIASMLAPVEFGRYFAVGSRVHSRGEAIFFEVDVDQLPPGEFPLELIGERCVAKADGTPKKSVYLAIYRVLSRVPVSALGRLHLVTRDGKTLSLERAEYTGETGRRAHLYQEFCPIEPVVASCWSSVAPSPIPRSRCMCRASCFPSWPCGAWRRTLRAAWPTTCPTPICSTCGMFSLCCSPMARSTVNW